MAAGYDLKEGKYDQTYKTAKDIKNTLELFFEKSSRKESTYKYAMFKAIIDNVDAATDKTYRISFDQLFARFSEIYWVLVFKYKIPQKVQSVKTSQTLAEKIIEETVAKYKIRGKTEFRTLSGSIQRELILKMKKNCSRYVFGALYAETNQLMYSFSKEKEWVKLNPLVVDYIKKHENAIQSQNYLAWGRFYSNVISLGEKDEGYYRRLLKREFGDNTVVYLAPLASGVKKKVSPLKSAKNTNKTPDGYDAEIAVKVRKVLAQYPDLGLYLAQICEKISGDKEKVRIVLDNSFWSRRDGSRYFYIDVADSEVVAEGMFEEDILPFEMSNEYEPESDDIDLEKLKLLDDPELLIKQLKKEKGIIPERKTIDLKNEETIEKEGRISTASTQKKWDREEVVILVTEYFRTKTMSAEKIKEGQEAISVFLRKREEQLSGVPVDDTFRNFAGIRMQSGRIRCLDPETRYSGMQGTQLQKQIVEEYLSNPQSIIDEAKEIYKKYQ